MKLSNTNKILGGLVLGRGPGSLAKNLQKVLDGLRQVATNACVERYVFEPHLTRLRRYFVELERVGCIGLTYEVLRGKKILQRLKLIKRDVPAVVVSTNTPNPVSAPNPTNLTQEDKFRILHQKDASRPTYPPHCLMFVDVPNLCNFLGIGPIPRGLHFVNFFRSDWTELRQVIVEQTQVPLLDQHCYMYARVIERHEPIFHKTCSALRHTGIHVETRAKKDIDPMLIPDMITKTIPYLNADREVHLVLVSGDGDFVFALRSMRQIARELGANLVITILAWRHQMSHELTYLAHQVLYLDTYLSRIDPEGARLLLRQGQQVPA